MRTTYKDITGRRISKKLWDAMAGKYGVRGNHIVIGGTIVGYREIYSNERDRVIAEGRY